MTIGLVIRNARESAGMTRSELCEKAGIGLSTLRGLEKGINSPRYDSLVLISNGLGIPLSRLIKRAEIIDHPEAYIYDKEETYPNCSVQVLTNTITGEQSWGWWKNE